MLKDITVGQYIYGTSPVHKMEARVKILLTIAYAAAVFMLKSSVSYAVYAAFTAAVIIISGVPIKMMVKGLKPLVPIFVFTTFFNLFFTEGREVLALDLRLLAVRITCEGIAASAVLAVRLVLLIMGCSLLTLTTPPLSLTDGIERLLSPLKKLRFPAHETALMMSVALRFVPTIADEAEDLIKAQKARGADLESGGLIRRARALVPIMIPLLTGAFRRADDLAEAMDARCYRGEGRTRMKETRAGRRDAAAAAVFAAVTVAAICCANAQGFKL